MSFIKKYLSTEISLLTFLYFIILNLWFSSILKKNLLGSIIKFDNLDFYFFPYITSFIFKNISSYLHENILGYAVIVLMPIGILLITNRLFNLFLKSKLSFLLALLTQSIYNDINLRDVFLNNNEILMSFKNDYLLIFNYPFPSVSVIVFILILSKIVLDRNSAHIIESYKITFLSFIYFYINAIDSFFLISVWTITLFFDFKKISLKHKIIQFFLGLIILSPGIFYGGIKEFHEYSLINLYNIILYNLVPLSLSVLLFVVKRIDYQEIWFKFKIIYVLMFVEISLNILVYLNVININLEVLNKQVLQFPIHMMYYLPLIYFFKREPFSYNYGIESKNISKKFSKLTFVLYNKSKDLIFYILLLLIFYFNFPK